MMESSILEVSGPRCNPPDNLIDGGDIALLSGNQTWLAGKIPPLSSTIVSSLNLYDLYG